MTKQAEGHQSRGWDPRSFYERHEELAGAYTEEISDHHRSKAALVATYCGRTRRVLELGAGGGQIAAAVTHRTN